MAPRISICEFTTLTASFEEDLAAYAAAGVRGIGVCEVKLPADGAARLRRSGLAATHCIPAVPSILPLPPMPGPETPAERVEALCAGIRRLAELGPECCVFLTGPAGSLGPAEARRVVLDAIPVVAEAARAAGVRAALEPVHPSQAAVFSFVDSLGAARALLDEAGADDVGLLVDTWHVWDDPGLEAELRASARRIAGVHLADRREPTRSHFDRVLPGHGVAPLRSIVRSLEACGYEGWYDVEIFSDNGAFGEHFADSLWDVPAAELARRARESALRLWGPG